jgi:SAM-dependent methyltransferase
MIIDPQKMEEGLLLSLIKPQGKRILEIGCGNGRASLILAKYADHYIAIDNDARAIEKAILQVTPELQDKIEFKVASAIRIPLLDKSMDTIFMLLSFHEIAMQEQGTALFEALRVLKDGGQIIIAEPEENPVASIQELFSLIDLFIKYFKHEVLINHSKWVIDSIAHDRNLKINRDSRYELDWKFINFDDMRNYLIADFFEIDWNDNNRQVVEKALREVVKNIDTSKPFIIPDRIEVTIITK